MGSWKNPNPNNGEREEFLHPLSANLPFTQCFESARQTAFLRYSYSEDRNLYVAGDLYDNEVLTPAVIVVPRRRGKAVYPREREEKNQKGAWVECDCDLSSSLSPAPRRKALKAAEVEKKFRRESHGLEFVSLIGN